MKKSFKYLVYVSDKIRIYSKDEMEFGQEGDMADEVFNASVKGWRAFLEHIVPGPEKTKLISRIKANANEILDNFLK